MADGGHGSIDDEVLTAEEAAALLKVATPTVLKESREGRLPGVKIGREWRYSRTALLAHLRQYPAPTVPPAGDEDAEPAAEGALTPSGRAAAATPPKGGGSPMSTSRSPS
jgi:excisionase family DNA binding protein